MRVGFIGYGLMAKRRWAHLGEDDVWGFQDPAIDARGTDVKPLSAICEHAHAVVVSTPTGLLVEKTLACIAAGARRILVEKPCGISAADFAPVIAAASSAKAVVVPGYTLRHYPGIIAAKTARYGLPLHMRIAYGHGGSAKGWRATWGGGGELLDQGSHCVDLARAFLGDHLDVAAGALTRRLLEHVEDNAFVTLRAGNRIATIHASWTEWKPTFQMRVVYEHGVAEVSGLSHTYGPHVATLYHERGVDEVLSYPEADKRALTSEWHAFKETTFEQSQAMLVSAHRTLELLDEVRCKSS